MDLMTWLRAEWDRVVGFSLIALGAVLLVLGYLGVSGSPYVAEQLSYIVSGGLGGLFLLGAGATLLILADLHDEWRKLDRVEAVLAAQAQAPTQTPAPVQTQTPVRAQANGSAPAPAPVATGPALMVEHDPAAPAVFRRERFSLGVGLLLALAVLFGSWARASSVEQAKPALAAAAVAVFGLVLVALGAVGSTLTVKRHVQLRKARLFSPWLTPGPDCAAGVDVAAPVPDGALVVAPGLTRYHRAGCPALAGLATRPVPRRSLPSGLAPCHLCDADAAG